MNRSYLLRFGGAVLTALLLASLISTCGEDKSTDPIPDPKVTMSLVDNGGRAGLTVRNTGGGYGKIQRLRRFV